MAQNVTKITKKTKLLIVGLSQNKLIIFTYRVTNRKVGKHGHLGFLGLSNEQDSGDAHSSLQ